MDTVQNVDMSGTLVPWVRLQTSRAKWHFCPQELAAGIVADLESRGVADVKVCPPGPDWPAEQCYGWLDLPGMVSIDRSIEELDIDGFKVEVASQNVAYFAEALSSLPQRRTADGREYYKLHGWLHCLVLTPHQRDLLTVELERVRARAEKIGADEEKSMLDVVQKMVDKGLMVSNRVKPTPAAKRPN